MPSADVKEVVIEGRNQAWKTGKYRVLLDAALHAGPSVRSDRRGYAWRGSLVVVEEFQTKHEDGRNRVWLQVRAEGSEPARDSVGWITWLDTRRPPLDIRDHLEHQKFLEPACPPRLEEGDEGVQPPDASPCRKKVTINSKESEGTPVEAPAEEEPAEQVPAEEAQAVEALDEGPLNEGEYIVNVARKAHVPIQVPGAGSHVHLGIHVQVPAEAGGLPLEEVLIDQLWSEGLIPDWNAENPESVVNVGDRIILVNAARGDAMLKELNESPHLSIRLRRAPYETARSSFHASSLGSDSEGEGSPSESARDRPRVQSGSAYTEGDESPRSLPPLQPISNEQLTDLYVSESSSSALLTSRSLLTSRAGSKEIGRMMQSQAVDTAIPWIMTDSPGSPTSKLADSPVVAPATGELSAYELPDQDAGSAFSSPAGHQASPSGAAGAMLLSVKLPPLPLGRRRPAAGPTPLSLLPLRLEEAAARAGYAWEPEASPTPLAGPTTAPPQAAARPSRACSWLGAAPEARGANQRHACASGHPTLTGLAAKLTCSDSRAGKVRGAGFFL